MSKFSVRGSNKNSGQILAIFGIAIFAALALVGLVWSAGDLYFGYTNGDIILENACQDGAERYRVTGNTDAAYAEFVDNLSKNGFAEDTYSPKVGTGRDLKRGFEYDPSSNTWFSALSWKQPVSFLSLFGVEGIPFTVKSRCVGATFGGSPSIAVQESNVYHSLSGEDPQVYTILGRDPKWVLVDEESGENFRGAVFPHMWCIPSSDPNCPSVRVFAPLEEAPPSPATQKKLVEDCFKGINCNIHPSAGTRIPIVGGTSNAQICKAFQSAGWMPGDYIPVMVFPNKVDSPEATYGNWESVVITGFTVYELASYEPNPKNCNHVKARLVSDKIYQHLTDLPSEFLLEPREINWNYEGVPIW